MPRYLDFASLNSPNPKLIILFLGLQLPNCANFYLLLNLWLIQCLHRHKNFSRHFLVSLQILTNFPILSKLDTWPESWAKSVYISCAVSNFNGIEIELWAGFRQDCSAEKNFGSIMSNFWGWFFHVFIGKKNLEFFLKIL